MASPATSSHLPALAEPHERDAVAHELQSTMQAQSERPATGFELRGRSWRSAAMLLATPEAPITDRRL